MRKFEKILIAILMFFYFYEVRLKGLPTIFSSRKVVVVLFCALLILKSKAKISIFKGLSSNAIREYKIYVVGIAGIWAYSFFLAIINHRMGEGYVDAKFLFFYFLYSIITPVLIWSLFNDVEDLFEVISIIGVVQATVVYILSVSSNLRLLLDTFLATETRLSYSTQLVKVYGVGAWGANGSVIMFLSIYSLGYLVMKGKEELLNIFFMVYVLMASVMVGRTGFYFGTILLFWVGFKKLESKMKASTFQKLIVLVPVLVVTIIIMLPRLVQMDAIKTRIETTIEHMDISTIVSKDNPSFVSDIRSMSYPEFSLDWIVGSGHGRGISSDGQDVQNDIGYIQRMYSLGVFISSFLYFLVFGFFVRIARIIANADDRKYYLILTLCLLILEFKEQFLYYYIIPAMILFTGMVIIKNQNIYANKSRMLLTGGNSI